MIQLDVQPYCHTCQYFEPRVDKLFADGAVLMNTVTCQRSELCMELFYHIKRAEKNKEEQNK